MGKANVDSAVDEFSQHELVLIVPAGAVPAHEHHAAERTLTQPENKLLKLRPRRGIDQRAAVRELHLVHGESAVMLANGVVNVNLNKRFYGLDSATRREQLLVELADVLWTIGAAGSIMFSATYTETLIEPHKQFWALPQVPVERIRLLLGEGEEVNDNGYRPEAWEADAHGHDRPFGARQLWRGTDNLLVSTLCPFGMSEGHARDLIGALRDIVNLALPEGLRLVYLPYWQSPRTDPSAVVQVYRVCRMTAVDSSTQSSGSGA